MARKRRSIYWIS